MNFPNIPIGGALMRAGVKVFPCREGGLSPKAPYTRRGFKEATTDLRAASAWSVTYPGAIWGLPCAANGVLVLDADRHGKGDGVANLIALFERWGFDWRSVPTVSTPNGGYHFYFKRPCALGRTKATLCEAVDIRDKAYVVAPGCQMPDGRSYRLVEGTLEDFTEAVAARWLPEPPSWMLPMLIHPPVPPPAETAPPIDDERIKNQIKGLIVALLSAEDGNRNRLLFWVACRLAELVREELLALELAEMLLDDAGHRIGLSTREIRATAISGLRTAWEGEHDVR